MHWRRRGQGFITYVLYHRVDRLKMHWCRRGQRIITYVLYHRIERLKMYWSKTGQGDTTDVNTEYALVQEEVEYQIWRT